MILIVFKEVATQSPLPDLNPLCKSLQLFSSLEDKLEFERVKPNNKEGLYFCAIHSGAVPPPYVLTFSSRPPDTSVFFTACDRAGEYMEDLDKIALYLKDMCDSGYQGISHTQYFLEHAWLPIEEVEMVYDPDFGEVDIDHYSSLLREGINEGLLTPKEQRGFAASQSLRSSPRVEH